MRKLFSILLAAFGTGLFISSCETTELDLTQDPNALSPSEAQVEFYVNSIQVRLADFIEDDFGRYGAELTRIENMFGRDYRNAYGPSDVNTEWDNAYQEILTDVREMQALAQEGEQFTHIAIGQVVEAIVITTLVDFFGDIPYSEALQGDANLNPATDPGADVYAAALALLDSAIANFNATSLDEPDIDFYYDGDKSKWIRLCNTLKMEIYLNTRLVDGGAVAAFKAIVDSGNYIQDSADDFQFQYGTNAVQPDTRHPRYGFNYINTGGQDYMSNWLMNLMDTSNDPRIRYYFYRQNATVPGADGTDPDEETLACSLTSAPQHYIDGGFTYCSLPNGYWGRDHGNDEGIPPDGLLRTVPGVYPAGGQFDDNSFDGISLGSGGGGAGITPLVLASWVDFWRAEIALLDNDPDGARDLMASGIMKSIAKVQPFAAVDAGADFSFEPSADDITNYMSSVESDFDDADMDGKWDIVAEQFYITLWGNGCDAYNFYRRTGYPSTLQPNVEPNPGTFVRSFFYPDNFANNNASVDQKADQTTQVFWDNNPASPAFPSAN